MRRAASFARRRRPSPRRETPSTIPDRMPPCPASGLISSDGGQLASILARSRFHGAHAPRGHRRAISVRSSRHDRDGNNGTSNIAMARELVAELLHGGGSFSRKGTFRATPHVHVYGARAQGSVIPHVSEQSIAREHAPAMLEQILQQQKFLAVRRTVSPPSDTVVVRVDADRPAARTRSHVRSRGSPQQRPHARDELVRAERFETYHRPRVEARCAGLFSPGGQHDDRQRRRAIVDRAPYTSSPLRLAHQIEDDESGASLWPHDRLAAVVNPFRAVPPFRDSARECAMSLSSSTIRMRDIVSVNVRKGTNTVHLAQNRAESLWPRRSAECIVDGWLALASCTPYLRRRRATEPYRTFSMFRIVRGCLPRWRCHDYRSSPARVGGCHWRFWATLALGLVMSGIALSLGRSTR